MNIDPSPANNALSLLNLTSGGPRSSISKLCSSTRAIPSPKDFHFLYKFDEFKLPAQKISKESHSMLSAIASSSHGEIEFSRNSLDDGFDYTVNVNDEVFKGLDASADDFQEMKRSEEESGKRGVESDDAAGSVLSGDAAVARSDWSAVKAASKLKPKAHFHVSTIRKPQEEFNILVDNSNKPFNHVWLQKSEDGKRFIHPLEKLSVSDFVDKDIGDVKPMEPLSLECTPFKLVEEVKDLEVLAAKLHSVNEFAVDLEHNHYRSFQGLTCLMQISTRTEDFVVDTLKLWIHVGPCLREVFKDPTKKKVMHGANRDIIWLQRDFGIYVCNLFDTGQASRVLKLESKSLEYLLHHYCGVTANKQYQTADWRVRPLPEEMIRYGREDTHYLLYIYDVMRIELSSVSEESGNADAPLLDVYNRSYDLCMRLYEKELLAEDSFLSIYGLQGANLNAHQLAVVAGLYEWRDAVARVEDESTGYILPNKSLLEIAKQMPVSSNKLLQLVKSNYWYLEHDLASVVSIIRRSMLNGPAFEAAAELLRQRYMETVSKDKALVNGRLEDDPPDMADVVDENTEPSDIIGSTSEQVTNNKGASSSEHHTGSVQSHNSSTNTSSSSSLKVLKEPDRSLWVLKRKLRKRSGRNGG